MCLGCCRWEYVQLYSGEDSLADSFPHALENMEGTRRYISAFQAPLQELSLAQVHAIRACSLLVIPPHQWGEPPPGGFPKDLSDLNLSSWASLVQDVTSGLLASPPNLGSEVSLPAVALLDLLEKTTGWVYCHFCYHIGSRCTCMGAYLSWSQVVGESPGCGATASSGGMTTPGTTTARMSRYLPPPPGLPLIDFSKWRLPVLEALASRANTASTSLPGVGRSIRLRGMAKRIVAAPHPGGLAHWMPALPMSTLGMPQTALPSSMLCAPQKAPPVQQPCPEWPATPYQQAVQLPKMPMGRGVTFYTPTGKTTPMGSASSQDHGRPATRGQGHSSQSVSHPRGALGEANAQPPCQEGDLPSKPMPSTPPPPPAAPERTQTQWGGQPRSALRNPARLVAKFHSSGWRKDLEHILWIYYRFSITSFMEGEWVRIKDRFFEHFLHHRGEALAIKENCPLDIMAYVQDLFYQAISLHLDGLGNFTGWIKWGSYYHGLVIQQGHLQECLHLVGVPMPRWPQVAPSESHQESLMKSEAQTPSSSRPRAGATATLIAEAPVAEAPVAETPIMEAPAEETPEAPVTPSSTPAPMETGGVGDGQSWAKEMEAGDEASFQRSQPAKRAHSQSRRCEPKSQLPFPLQDSEGRFPPSHSCMSMQLCSQLPHTMWQVRRLGIYTPTCHLNRPRTSETRWTV